MRNMIFILVFLLSLNSCSNDNNKQEMEDNSIVGTWQLIKDKIGSHDGTANWNNIDKGYKITFNKDLSYEPEITPTNCNRISSSEYLTRNTPEVNILEININCDNPDTHFKSIFYYRFEKGNLVLTPIDPKCPEGCVFMYKRIK